MGNCDLVGLLKQLSELYDKIQHSLYAIKHDVRLERGFSRADLVNQVCAAMAVFDQGLERLRGSLSPCAVERLLQEHVPEYYKAAWVARG